MVWRLRYKDANANVQILSTIRKEPPSGAYVGKRARWHTRSRAVDKLTFIAEGDMFGNVPVVKGDFDGSEPDIYFDGRRFSKAVSGVDTANDEFVVSGDVTGDFETGGSVLIEGSTGNDGNYTVKDSSSVTYDSNNNETTIAVQEDVTDSTADGTLTGFEAVFRGFPESQGVITDRGNHKIILRGFEKFIGRQDVSITTAVTGTIKDVMSQLTPSGYTLDTPSSSNVTYKDSTGTEQTGFAPVDSWTLTDLREVGFREMTRLYGYSIQVKPDKTIRYEPIGFGSSIDTIDSPVEGDTSNTRGKFKEWTKGRTPGIVNVIKVVNDKGGNDYSSGVVKNQSSIDDYGERPPPGGLTKKMGFVDSDTEAQRVAENIVKAEQNPGEGGVVNVPGHYLGNVSNSSFTLNDSQRGIASEVFTCWEQVNYYPEQKSELRFSFESQAEEEVGIRDDVRGERSTKVTTSSTDVGQQGDGSLANDQANAQVGGSESNKDPNVENNTARTGSRGAGNFSNQQSDSGLTIDGNWHALSTTWTAGSSDYLIFYAAGNLALEMDFGSGVNLSGTAAVRVKNETDDNFYPDSGGLDIMRAGGTNIQWLNSDFIIPVPRNVTGDTMELHYNIPSGWSDEANSAIIDYRYWEELDHEHSPGSNMQAASHAHGVTHNDSGHGDSGTSEHVIDGTTGSKNVDIVQSPSKEDR